MKYKVRNKNNTSKIRSGGKQFVIKKTEDKVILSFDESNQLFTARIEHPSAHTQYLFNEGKLGIDLCKLNTGRSQRKHMGVRDDITAQTGEDYVKKHYHPRWTRVYGAPGGPSEIHYVCPRGCVIVDDMSYIEIPILVDRFKPNQTKTLNNRPNWFTAVKAVLVAANSQTIHNRSYKTCSNRIKVVYDSINGELHQRPEHSGGGASITFDVNIQKASQDATTYRVQLSNLSARAQQLFNQGYLFIATRYIDVHTRNDGGNGKRSRWGLGIDPDPENIRWAPMFYRKLKLSPDSRQTINSLDFTYRVGTNRPNGIADLLHMVRITHSNNDPMSITRTAYIVVGYTTGSLCTTHTLQTDLNTTWTSDEP